MASLVANSETVSGQQSPAAQQPATKLPNVPRPEPDPSGEVEVISILDRSGSDFMVDVIKSLNFEFVASNPGSSFRGIQESLINYRGNKNPEFLTCMHEESAVHMAQGYAQVEGRPMLVTG